jgi:hypothetical protein
MFRLALARIKSVFLFLVIIAVIDLGHLPHTCAAPGPSGFTRIARDLSRKSCAISLKRAQIDAPSAV